MDAVLGVAVTGASARLALVGADGARSVIDRSEVALPGDPTEHLTETIAGTHQGLASEGHRLVATQVCWSDEAMTAQLQQLLSNAGVGGVSVVSEADAATALVRSLPHTEPGHGSALLLVDNDAATLSIVGADEVTTTVVAAEPLAGSDAVTACRVLLERLREEPGSADDIYLVGNTDEITAYADQLRAESPVPLEVVGNPAFALAEGAAYAAPTLASLDSVMTVAAPQLGPQLAYSQAAESGPLPFETGSYGDVPMQSAMAPLSATPYDDPQEVEEDRAPQARPRMLLIGSSVAGVVVVGFAALAVTVAIGIRPTAAVAPVPNEQQYVKTPQDKFLPYVPQQAIIPGPTGPVPVEKAVEPVQGTSEVRTVWVPSTRSGGNVDVPRGTNISINPPQGVTPPIDNPVQGVPQPGFQMPNIPLPQINLPDNINFPIINPGQNGNPVGPISGGQLGINNNQIGGNTSGSNDQVDRGANTGGHQTLTGGSSTPGGETGAGSSATGGGSAGSSTDTGAGANTGSTSGIGAGTPSLSGSGQSSGTQSGASSSNSSSGGGSSSGTPPIVQQVTPPVVEQAPAPVVEPPAPVEQAPAPSGGLGGIKIPFLGGLGGGVGSSSSGGSSGSGSSSSGSGSSGSDSSSGSSTGSSGGSSSSGGGLIPFLPLP